jgi:hypothetical protein
MPAQWDGYALRNLIVINPHHVQALDVLVCHEMRHIWQYHTGAVMRFDLPYPDQPHEQDARAHQFPCATAIARQPVMASPVQPQATTLARLSWASPVDTASVQQPDPAPITTATLSLPDSALFSIALLGLMIGGVAVRQTPTGSHDHRDTATPAAKHSALGHWLTTVDWALVYRTTAKVLALVFLLWAVAKALAVWQAFGLLYAVLFAGLNLPLCGFSTLFVLWLFDDHEGMGLLALLSAFSNAMLI